MKLKLFALTAMLTSSVFAQYHGDITPLKEKKEAIKGLVSNFRLPLQQGEIQSPDYTWVAKEFLHRLDLINQDVATILAKMQEDLAPHYRQVVSGKVLKSRAGRRTFRATKKNLKRQLKKHQETYHRAIRSVIFQDAWLRFLEGCRSIYCLERLSHDLEIWAVYGSKINKTLPVYRQMKVRRIRKGKNYWRRKVKRAVKKKMNELITAKSLPGFLYENNPSYQRLTDKRLTLKDILDYGTGRIADIGLDAARERVANGEPTEIVEAATARRIYDNLAYPEKLFVGAKFNFELEFDTLGKRYRCNRLVEDGSYSIKCDGFKTFAGDSWAAVNASDFQTFRLHEEFCSEFGLTRGKPSFDLGHPYGHKLVDIKENHVETNSTSGKIISFNCTRGRDLTSAAVDYSVKQDAGDYIRIVGPKFRMDGVWYDVVALGRHRQSLSAICSAFGYTRGAYNKDAWQYRESGQPRTIYVHAGMNDTYMSSHPYSWTDIYCVK